MSKVFIEESTLTAIGDAIREKTGKAELIAPGNMSAEIASITTGGGGEVEPLVLTGEQAYGCAGAVAGAYIEMFGNTISTQDITNMNYMFNYNTAKKIPFVINIKGDWSGRINLGGAFANMLDLTTAPTLAGTIKPSEMTNLFYSCYSLKEIPDDFFSKMDLSYFSSSTSAYSGIANSLFNGCFSLRKVNLDFVRQMNPYGGTYNNIYYNLFNYCKSLDEVVNLPIPFTVKEYTENLFQDTFAYCNRLKNITFETPDGQPVVVKWKNQTLRLYMGVGYGFIASAYGFDSTKQVIDDATYQALKDDPDWWTEDMAYSRYNHDSAVATINSLPDASAYLATAGGTNTIEFGGVVGSKTDGGAINTLTEEEIAVAAAKGWTVTFV